MSARRPGYFIRLFSVMVLLVTIVTPSMMAQPPPTALTNSNSTRSDISATQIVKVDPELQEMVSQHKEGTVKLIVLLRDKVSLQSIEQMIESGTDFRLIDTFRIIPAVLIEARISQVSRLFSIGEIRSVYLNKEYKLSPINKTAYAWLSRSPASPWIQAINLPSKTLANGYGVTVGVGDSGIDSSHPDLAGKVIGVNSFVNTIYGYLSNDTSSDDTNGHGTYVAGIIAGGGVIDPELQGVATEVKLVSAKCIDEFGRGFTAGIIKAIEWANATGCNVINLSLGGGSGDPDDPMSLAVDNAVKSGVVVVVAAGNEGPSYSTAGVPGAAKLAISVGASNGSSSVASFSSRGPTLDGRVYPDVLAPGVDIVSALSPDSAIAAYASRLGLSIKSWYVSLDGTSAAAPLVSGAVALLLSASGLTQLNRSTVSSESRIEIASTMRIALMHTAKSLGLDSNAQGAGLIDVLAAYNYLLAFGTRTHYPIVKVSPRNLINPPYLIGYIGDAAEFAVSLLTASKTNLTVSVSGNASSLLEFSSTSFANAVGLTILKVNLTIPVNAEMRRYIGQIGFTNTTSSQLIIGENVTIDIQVRNPRGKLYFDIFHSEAQLSIMSGLYRLVKTLNDLGYSAYEGNVPIAYSRISEYDVVVLSEPKIMFSPEEVNAIHRFVTNNGSLLVMGSYYPNFAAESVNQVLYEYGIQFEKNLIANYSDMVVTKVVNVMIEVTNLTLHPVTSGVTKYSFGYGSTLQVSAPVSSLAFTPSQWGDLPVLAACDLSSGGRIIASGSSIFASDSFFNVSTYPGNVILAENAVGWLLNKSQVSVQVVSPGRSVRTGEQFQVGVIATNRTSGLPLSAQVTCTADNGSSIPIMIRNDTVGIFYNTSVTLQSDGFYEFTANATFDLGGQRALKMFEVEVIDKPPRIMNLTLTTHLNPLITYPLPLYYQSLLPTGTPIISRYGDYVNITVEVPGMSTSDSNVSIYLTRSPSLYIDSDKPLTYLSLTAQRIGISDTYRAQYKPTLANGSDIYLFWVMANSGGHISIFNLVNTIFVASIDPQIDDKTTFIGGYALAGLRNEYLYPISARVGDQISVVVNGSDTEDSIDKMRAWVILVDPSLYLVPGLPYAELIVSGIPFNNQSGTFVGTLAIPESGVVEFLGSTSNLSLLVEWFYLFILLVDSDGAYSLDAAAVWILPKASSLFTPEVIFTILGVSIVVPLLIIFVLNARTKAREKASAVRAAKPDSIVILLLGATSSSVASQHWLRS